MLTDGLAPDHIVRQFNQMCRLRPVARKVLDSSRANKDDGNQWIVVHSLTDKAIDKLDNDKKHSEGLFPLPMGGNYWAD